MIWFKAQTIPELKQEYKKLAKKYHPDIGGTDEIMSDINNEYNTLLLHLFDINTSYKDFQIEHQMDFESFIRTLLNINNVNITIDVIDDLVQINNSKYLWSKKDDAWRWYEPLRLNYIKKV